MESVFGLVSLLYAALNFIHRYLFDNSLSIDRGYNLQLESSHMLVYV
ncbi:MAG: hypothetical protein RLZZ419_2037 [Pseudomonadota bacterium]